MKENFLIYQFFPFLVVVSILVWPLESSASKSNHFPSDHTLIIEPGRGDIDLNNQSVQSVVISPDEKLLAAGGHDSTLRIWDFETCQLKKILQFKHAEHLTNIVSVNFSPDGRWLAAGGKDWAVYLWKTEEIFKNHTPIKLLGHSQGIRSVVFSPDGEYLASTGHDGSIRIWRLGNEIEEHAVLLGHERTVYSLTFSKDGKTLLSGSEDKTVRTWNIELKKQIQQMTTPGTVRVAKFTPDGKYIVGAIEKWDGGDPPVLVWDANLKKSIHTLLGHSGAPTALAISRDGHHVATGGYDGTIRLWDILAGKLVKTLRTEVPVGRSDFLGRQVITYPNQPVRTLTFTKNGQYIVSGSYKFTPWLWDRESGKVLKVYRNKGCEP